MRDAVSGSAGREAHCGLQHLEAFDDQPLHFLLTSSCPPVWPGRTTQMPVRHPTLEAGMPPAVAGDKGVGHLHGVGSNGSDFYPRLAHQVSTARPSRPRSATACAPVPRPDRGGPPRRAYRRYNNTLLTLVDLLSHADARDPAWRLRHQLVTCNARVLQDPHADWDAVIPRAPGARPSALAAPRPPACAPRLRTSRRRGGGSGRGGRGGRRHDGRGGGRRGGRRGGRHGRGPAPGGGGSNRGREAGGPGRSGREQGPAGGGGGRSKGRGGGEEDVGECEARGGAGGPELPRRPSERRHTPMRTPHGAESPSSPWRSRAIPRTLMSPSSRSGTFSTDSRRCATPWEPGG